MNTQTRRPLGARERFFWMLDQYRPLHFTMAASVTGTQPVENWHRALAAVQQQHPLFSVAIQLNENKVPEFITQVGCPIPLKVVKTTGETAWVSELEQDMVQRFDSTSAPLVRAALYEYENQTVIALTAHHSISDGRSLTYALRDLLNALNGKYAQPYDMPPAMDLYTDLPENALNEISIPDEIVADFKHQPPAARAKPQIHLMELSKELSAQVINRSKQERATVHGALCAALELASRSWKPNPIRIYSPSSVRQALGMSDTSCVSIAARTISLDKNASRSFWETARFVKETLTGANSVEEASRIINIMFNLVKNHAIDTVPTSEYMMSNIGVLPFNTDYGPLQLDAVWGPFILTGYEGCQSLGVATINGSIRIALTSAGNIQVKPVLEFVEQILSMECAPVSNLPHIQI
ncbi:MAG: condensation domain-containing protein [Mucilaginibacter sp.]|uniref:condensation domain-containing protein n=1 Tax=Mucilaginibacter sp. TaxID=1882438 RepID=UPI0031A23C39